MKTAVVSFRYPVERSPTVKGIVEYLAARGFASALFVESASAELRAELPTPHLVTLLTPAASRARDCILRAAACLKEIPVVGRGLYRRLTAGLAAALTWPAARALRATIRAYDLVYCVEAHSLFLLDRVKFPLDRCVYVSLELQQIIAEYGMRRAAPLVERCAVRLVQSPERAGLLNRSLGRVLRYRYMPVSTAPYSPARSDRSGGGPIRLVYSGYIAKWSHLRDFLLAYREIEKEMPVTLTVHGHSEGTEEYLEEIRSLVACLRTARFDEEPMSERTHRQFLETYDVGVGLYMPAPGNDNWKGLLQSSGKIASYLWSGLAVITNIVDDDTRSLPFLFVGEPSAEELLGALRAFTSHRQACASEALRYAREHFNIFAHLDTLHSSLGSLVSA